MLPVTAGAVKSSANWSTASGRRSAARRLMIVSSGPSAQYRCRSTVTYRYAQAPEVLDVAEVADEGEEH